MTTDVHEVERRMVSLAQELTAVRPGECVLCYVQRMLIEFDCDNTRRWSHRWWTERAPRGTLKERNLTADEPACDCELFRDSWQPAWDLRRRAWAWPPERGGCEGVTGGASRPCGIWVRRRPRGTGLCRATVGRVHAWVRDLMG